MPIFHRLWMVLCLLALSDHACAQPLQGLDAKGRQIYEALLESAPTNESLSALKDLKVELLRVSGHPRYAKPPGNRSIAEVVYEFKLSPGSTENRIVFLIYPDKEAAGRYLQSSPNWPSQLTMDGLQGFFRHVVTKPDDVFDKEQHSIFGVEFQTNKSWVRWAYQIDRIVIVSKTDSDRPGVALHDDSELDKLTTEGNNAFMLRGWVLLGIGKTTLNTPGLKPLLQ